MVFKRIQGSRQIKTKTSCFVQYCIQLLLDIAPLTAIPQPSEHAMVAGDAGGKLNIHVEFAQPVGHEQLPFGFRSFGILRPSRETHGNKGLEARLSRRLIVPNLAKSEFEPTGVIRGDF